MEAATNRPMRAFNINKVSYARNLGGIAKCVLYFVTPDLQTNAMLVYISYCLFIYAI